MINFKDLDSSATLREQSTDTSGLPVVMLNLFKVDPKDDEAFKAAWAKDAEFFKQQPGWISAQLLRGVGESHLWCNYAVFENAETFAAMNRLPGFEALQKGFPDSTVAQPHLFKRVRVPGVCLGDE